MNVSGDAAQRAALYEREAVVWMRKAQAGEAGAVGMAQACASLAAAARLEHAQWRMRVLGDQMAGLETALGQLRRKLPDR